MKAQELRELGVEELRNRESDLAEQPAVFGLHQDRAAARPTGRHRDPVLGVERYRFREVGGFARSDDLRGHGEHRILRDGP